MKPQTPFVLILSRQLLPLQNWQTYPDDLSARSGDFLHSAAQQQRGGSGQNR